MTSSRVAVVTGSNKGIGYTIVKNLCKQFKGVVYLTARDVTRGKSAVESLEKLGFKPEFHQLDINDKESISTFAEYLKSKYGGIDVLVNNAAIAFKHDATEPFGIQAEVTLRTNFFALVDICNALYPLLRPHARVVTVSSSCGHLPLIPGKQLRKMLANPDIQLDELSQCMKDFIDPCTRNIPKTMLAEVMNNHLSPLLTVIKTVVVTDSLLESTRQDEQSGRSVLGLFKPVERVNESYLNSLTAILRNHELVMRVVIPAEGSEQCSVSQVNSSEGEETLDKCIRTDGGSFGVLDSHEKQDATESFGLQAEETLRTNYFALMDVCNSLYPLLRPHARVVTISSSAGHLLRIPGEELRKKFANPDIQLGELSQLMTDFIDAAKRGDHEKHGWPNSTYVVSKVGASTLTRIHHREFLKDSREDIVINHVHPGYVDTDMTSHKGPLTVEQGADAPTYLALLPEGVTSPKGDYIWCTREIVDWVNGPLPAKW